MLRKIHRYIDRETGKEWRCSNCGARWNESGSLSCPYFHSPLSSSVRTEYQPKISK